MMDALTKKLQKLELKINENFYKFCLIYDQTLNGLKLLY